MPFDVTGSDICLYNRKVEEILKELKKTYKNNPIEELREIAEQRAAPYIFHNKEAERPH